MAKKSKLFYTISLWFFLVGILLTSLPAYAASPENYIPDAPGGLRIGVAQREKTLILLDEPELIKTVFDLGWIHMRDEFNSRVVDFINDVNDQGTIEIESHLATVDNAELRVMQIDKGAALKYILHHNAMYLKLNLPEVVQLSYVINFDVEMEIAIQASNEGQRLRLTDAAIYIRNTRIIGADWISKLMLPLIETLFQSAQEQAEKVNNPLLPIMRGITKQLTLFVVEALEKIPSTAIYTDIAVSPTNGMITFCFKSSPQYACKFPI